MVAVQRIVIDKPRDKKIIKRRNKNKNKIEPFNVIFLSEDNSP